MLSRLIIRRCAVIAALVVPIGVAAIALLPTADAATAGAGSSRGLLATTGGTDVTTTDVTTTTESTTTTEAATTTGEATTSTTAPTTSTTVPSTTSTTAPPSPRFVAFPDPRRLVDSRAGQLGLIELPGGSIGSDLRSKLQPGTPRRFVIGGQADIPINALAIALDVVAVSPAAPGYISVYPCQTAAATPPSTSTLNYGTTDIANAALVTALNGSICVISSQPVDLILDATGYFPNDADLIAFPGPVRLLDSRPGQRGVIEQSGGSLGFDFSSKLLARVPKRFVIGGQAAIPAIAAAVAVDIVAVGPTSPGYLSLYPCASAADSPPSTSTLNFATNDIANAALVAMQSGGVCIVASQSIDVVLDATGYFPSGSTFTTFAQPTRLLDTRPAQVGAIERPGGSVGHDIVTKVGAATAVRFVIGGQAGIPIDAGAVAVNIVAVGPPGAGFISLYPCSAATDRPPATSSLNYLRSDIANSALVRMSSGGVCVISNQSVDVVIDATGYMH